MNIRAQRTAKQYNLCSSIISLALGVESIACAIAIGFINEQNCKPTRVEREILVACVNEGAA